MDRARDNCNRGKVAHVAPEQPNEPRHQFLGFAALAVAAVVAAAAAFYAFTSSDKSSPTSVPVSQQSGAPTPVPGTGVLSSERPEIGRPAPDFALVDARDSAAIVKLSDFRGKAVVLNWYASWCGPCRREIPDFEQAQQILAGEVVFVGVNYLESSSRAVAMLDEFGGTYPAVLDSSGVVSDHYRITFMPTTFFIDRDGILRSVKTGQVSPDDLTRHLERVGVTYTAP